MEYRWGITTSHKAGEDLTAKARALAGFWQTEYIPRQGKAFGELKGELGLDQLLVLDKNQRLFSEEPPLEWHPSMAVPRLRALYEGRPDNFLKAAALAPGQHLLDCTLGLGADALLAAAAVGPAGRVLGLEASPAVAAVTAWGLAHQAVRYQHRKTPVADLAARISVLAAEALEYLRSQPDASWDVVYFDPMFRAAQNRSAAMNCLRPFAFYQALDQTALAEALRVARFRVVVKERPFAGLFRQLHCPRLEGGRYSSVAYGVWEKPAAGKHGFEV